MSAAADTVGTGVGGWLGFIGSTLAAIPGQYATGLRRHRGRTIGLTILFLAVITYPVIGHYALANFRSA